jgi:hypothetical protein
MFVDGDRVLLPGPGFCVGHCDFRVQHAQREKLELRMIIECSPTAILAYLYD